MGPVSVWHVYQADPASHPTGLQVEFINPIFEFSRAMRRLGLDDAEYALLIAINIFSADRPNVQEPSRVEALQQPYVEALLSYTRIKRPQVPELRVDTLLRSGEGQKIRTCVGSAWGWGLASLSERGLSDSLAPMLSLASAHTGSPGSARGRRPSWWSWRADQSLTVWGLTSSHLLPVPHRTSCASLAC